MRVLAFGPPGAALAVLAAALLAGGPLARAEFKVGGELPEFTLKAPDGTSFSLQRKPGQVVVVTGDKRTEPKALALHLFQPDCLQCQAQLRALEKLNQDFGAKGIVFVGVARRGDAKAVQATADQLKATFPLLVGTDSDLARQFGAGDAFAIADQAGVVRFAQAGYGQGDEKLWREALGLLLEGKPVAHATVDRTRLEVGDRLPPVELDSLRTGKSLVLNGEGGKLTFRDEGGTVSHPRAAVGMFARYWTATREEMVHLQKLQDKYGKDGLQTFAIAVFPNREKAQQLTKGMGVTYPVFNGYDSDLAKRYAFGWPIYVVDAGGVIRFTQLVGGGAVDDQKVEQAVQDLLKAK